MVISTRGINLCFLLVLCGLASSSPVGDDLKVDVTGGTVQGTNLRGHRAWLGIPYAEKPLKHLRFAPPSPVVPWSDTLPTQTPRDACEQTADTVFGDFSGSVQWNAVNVSEDCLYLNVHTPQDFDGNLPVLVWIYGGGYMTGSATLEVYEPDAFINTGKVVYVAMQYRLGINGFLYLGKNSGAPGNVGLIDQVMALEWVRANIAKFGGDPNDITLMGESAGANSVAIHMAANRRLFDKAILQSTGVNARWAYSDPATSLAKAESLAAKVNCPTPELDILACLQNKTSAELRAFEYDADVVGDYTVNLFPFGPTFDDRQIDWLEKAIERFRKPVLLGSNANEGFWSLMYLDPLFPNNELTEAEMTITEEVFIEKVNSIFSFYPENVRNEAIELYSDRFSGPTKYFLALDQMVADSDFVCNTEDVARRLSKSGADVYRYYYAHRSSLDPWPEYSGVKHGDELEFTFGRPLILENADYTDAEVTFAQDVVDMWVDFAVTGCPDGSAWPKYERRSDWQLLSLSAANSEVVTADETSIEEYCPFWIRRVPQLMGEGKRGGRRRGSGKGGRRRN